MNTFHADRTAVAVRLKAWILVVATIGLCAIWIALFIAHGYQSDGLVVFNGDDVGGRVWQVHATQIETLLAELSATIVAALAVGIWTTRKR